MIQANFKLHSSDILKEESDWDYAIVCNTGISPEQIQNGTFLLRTCF